MSACTACDQDCEARFLCRQCKQVLNVCSHRVGGFEAEDDICAQCHFRMTMHGKVRRSSLEHCNSWKAGV